MKTKLFLILMVLHVAMATAQKNIHLFPANYGKDGKAGYIDSSGNVIIPYNFDEVSGFSDGLAAVRTGELWGYIDESGKFVIPAKFTYAQAFSYGVAQIYYQDKTQFVNKDGTIFNVQCESYENFYEGMIKIKVDDLFGFADFKGKTIVPAEYDQAYSYKEGIGYASKNGEWYFFDKQGKLVFKTKYEPVGRYFEGLIQVKIGDKTGFMDKTGKLVIPADLQFRNNSEYAFSDGLAVFLEGPGYYDYKMGCIDKKGKVVIKPTFSLIYPFSNGMAAFSETKDGYIDKTGKIIVPAQYDNAFEFSEGYAVAIRGLGEGKYQYEILNKKGEIVKTFEAYEGIRSGTKFSHGLCMLYQTIPASPDMKDENMRQWGGVKTIYVNYKGNIVWQSEPWYSCFPGSAKVLMADYSEKPIAEIKAGDQILSFDKKVEKTKISIVTELQRHTGIYYLMEVFYSNNSELTADKNHMVSNSLQSIKLTPNHPILAALGNKPAGKLNIGDEIFIFNQLTRKIERAKVEKRNYNQNMIENVFNLKLTGVNYVVDGVIVIMK
jgi:hypothetical protein